MKKIYLFLNLLCLFLSAQLLAQHNISELPTSINENGAAPDSSAILDLQAEGKGLLIPRMDMAARDSMSVPALGLLIFQTDSISGFYYFDGTGWASVGTDAGAGGSPDDELNISAALNGTNLELTDAGGTLVVDLSALQDGVDDADTDPSNEIQDLQLIDNALTITNNGNASHIDLSPYLDDTNTQLSEAEVDAFVENNGYITSPDDADADPTNEIELPAGGSNGQILTTDGSGTYSWTDDTDSQTLSFNGTSLSIDGGNTVDISSLAEEDWVISSGTNITNANDGNVGIGNMAPTQNRWQLTVKDTTNCMLGSDSIDVSELFAVFTRNLNENNVGIGIGFQSTSTVTGMGAAIVHERTNSNSRGKLHFATKASGSAADEDLPIRMTIDETGDLGIGVTSPSEKLHVNGGNVLASRDVTTQSLTRHLTLGGARNGSGSPFARIDFQNYDNNGGLTDYVGASIRTNNSGDETDKGNLRFLTYNGSLSERMVITEAGLVGIGETSPQASLDVVDQAVIGNVSIGSESTDQGTSNLAGDGFAVTPWLYTNAVEAQDERGSASTLITVGNDGTYGAADQIHFVTSGNSQMSIASDGKVGIDKTPDTDLHIRQSQQSITSGTGGIKLETSSDATDYWRMYHSGIYLSFNLQGSRVAYINTNGSWTVDSDRSLKKNIHSMPSVLDRVLQLRPVKYHYNEQSNTDKQSIGFIAQETLPLFPEMVVEGENGKLGMTYSTAGIIALKAIQEQQAQIEALQARNRELEAQVAKINQLEAAIEALTSQANNDKKTEE